MEALIAVVDRGRIDADRVGVLFCDIDRFKVVNDSLGHNVGRPAAGGRRPAAACDPGADVVARFGGDEFVVVCHGLLEPESVIKVALSVRAAFEQPFSVSDGELLVSPSIGVAVWDPSTSEIMTAEEMVRDADAAMYEAKRSRSGVSVFDSDIRHNLVSRLRIEQSLSSALDNEIVVHYQPVIDAAGRVIYGIEALVRWDHPEHGLLFPGDFLGVAEDAGLVSRIGMLVLREACAQAVHWNHLHTGCQRISMSVNVAEHQLLDAAFPDRVVETLEWSGLPPEQLCLEISEELVTEHLAGSLPALEHLAAKGVHLSLDDFGTGRTTLSHLKRLNDIVHQVKIDRAFITHLPTDAVDQAVVEAVSRIATAAGLSVVAEGVETDAQARHLLQLGIANHQGFLYSRAVPGETLTAVFREARGLLSRARRRRPSRSTHCCEPGAGLGAAAGATVADRERRHRRQGLGQLALDAVESDPGRVLLEPGRDAEQLVGLAAPGNGQGADIDQRRRRARHHLVEQGRRVVDPPAGDEPTAVDLGPGVADAQPDPPGSPQQVEPPRPAQRTRQGLRPVAHVGRLLVALLGGERGEPGLEGREEPIGPPGEPLDQLVDHSPVVGLGGGARAGAARDPELRRGAHLRCRWSAPAAGCSAGPVRRSGSPPRSAVPSASTTPARGTGRRRR